MEIEELTLSARRYGVLKTIGIDTVEDLCLLTAEQLLGLGNFGEKSLHEVKQALETHSLSLSAGPPDTSLLMSGPVREFGSTSASASGSPISKTWRGTPSGNSRGLRGGCCT